MSDNHKCGPYDHVTKVALEAKNKISREKIWDANESKLKRNNPNILFTKASAKVSGKSDTLKIPDPEKQEKGAKSNKHTEFKKASTRLHLRLKILKEDFAPIPDNTEYSLDITDSDGNSWTEENKETGWKPGKVKHPPIKDGLLKVEVPPTAEKGELVLRLKAEDTDKPKSADGDGGTKANGEDKNKANRGDVPVTWELKIGALNPILEKAPNKKCISGVQQRLNNLGFNSGPVDGKRGKITKGAVKAFQTLFKLKVDTDPGPETQGKLDKVHDEKKIVTIPKD